MAHVQKYTRAQVGGLTRHYERAKKENGDYYQFGNQEVDTTRTHLNYNFAPARDQLSFISRRISEVECVSRANINVMCSWVVTAPKELDESELYQFFEKTYEFLNDRYAGGSDKNVISAYVHMDEVSPHLHYAFVPVVYDAEKGIDKVSAKAVINRRELKTFHEDLERHMAILFGREVGILNGATKDGNKSIDELKRGSAQREMSAMRVRADRIQAEIDSLVALRALRETEMRDYIRKAQATVNDYENKKRELEKRVDSLNEKLEGYELTREHIQKIDFKKKISSPYFGSSRPMATMPVSDWRAIKETALTVVDAKAEVADLRDQIEILNQTVQRLNRMVQQREGENDALEREKRELRLRMRELDSARVFQERFQYVPRNRLEEIAAQYAPKPEPKSKPTRRPVNRDMDWDMEL